MSGIPIEKRDAPRVININFTKLADTMIQGPYNDSDGYRINIKPPGAGRPRSYYWPREKPALQFRDALVAAQKILRDGSPISLEDQEFEATPEGYRQAIGRRTKELMEDQSNRTLPGVIRSLCEASRADKDMRDLDRLFQKMDDVEVIIDELQGEIVRMRTENQKLRALHGQDMKEAESEVGSMGASDDGDVDAGGDVVNDGEMN